MLFWRHWRLKLKNYVRRKKQQNSLSQKKRQFALRIDAKVKDTKVSSLESSKDRGCWIFSSYAFSEIIFLTLFTFALLKEYRSLNPYHLREPIKKLPIRCGSCVLIFLFISKVLIFRKELKQLVSKRKWRTSSKF